MRYQTRLFVTTQGCTNAVAARELAHELAPPLDELYRFRHLLTESDAP
jgi:hypothetical protein